jgi:hypothetical protein
MCDQPAHRKKLQNKMSKPLNEYFEEDWQNWFKRINKQIEDLKVNGGTTAQIDWYVAYLDSARTAYDLYLKHDLGTMVEDDCKPEEPYPDESS